VEETKSTPLLGENINRDRCRRIKEYRRRTRPMDGFKSRAGAINFLRIWLTKENARMEKEDWLKAVVN
jgi:hypothetical protein